MSEPLRVATFNIRCGNANDGPDRWELRRPRAEAFLQELNPDLLGVQEAIAAQMDDLHAAFPEWRSIGVGRDDGIRDGEHSAIFYDPGRLRCHDSGTFWFSDTPDVPGSMSWGNNICRACTWGSFEDLVSGSRFFHFNLHIDHLSGPSRDRSAAYLLERISTLPEGSRAIVTGDFNEGENAPGIIRMKQGGFRDSFRAIHPDEKDAGTFQGFTDDLEPDKIDYIFVDPQTEVIDAAIVRQKVGGRWPSDHAAVTATIRI